MTSPDLPFWDAVEGIREHDLRFRREAYGFLMAALGVTAQGLPAGRRADPLRRHLTGQELLAGVVALARHEFGPMAPTVFEEWGVRSSEDVGEMVFRLIECGQLSARPEDRREDFSGGIDLMRELRAGNGAGNPGSRGPSRSRPDPPAGPIHPA